MSFSSRRFFLGLLFCLALSSGVLIWKGQIIHPTPLSYAHPLPENFLTKAHITTFDTKSGSIRQELFSPRIEYYASGRHLIAWQPQYYFVGDLGHRWFITAKKAKASPELDQIHLENHVQVTLGTPPSQSLLETEALRILPQKNIAETASRVHIHQVGIDLESKGMKANLNKESMELLSDVHSEYRS